jgi:Uma2 family endonuclease
MHPAEVLNFVSAEDYLAGELDGDIKHEYVGGAIYATTDARNVHNQIATNASGALWNRLRGKRCRAFNSDTKIRIRLETHVRFYYPDASVTCRPNPRQDAFQDDPALVVEVLSARTQRIDLGEKKDAYLAIPSLQTYLLVDQESPTVVVFRRSAHGFVREESRGLEAVGPHTEIDTELPLAEIYDGVEFGPEPEDD